MTTVTFIYFLPKLGLMGVYPFGTLPTKDA